MPDITQEAFRLWPILNSEKGISAMWPVSACVEREADVLRDREHRPRPGLTGWHLKVATNRARKRSRPG